MNTSGGNTRKYWSNKVAITGDTKEKHADFTFCPFFFFYFFFLDVLNGGQQTPSEERRRAQHPSNQIASHSNFSFSLSP
jgi:hypothetical protein